MKILVKIILVVLLITPTIGWGQKLSDEDQSRFDYYFFEAQRLKDVGEVDAQYDALRICMEIDSTNTSLWYELGQVHMLMKRPSEAMEAYKKAAKADPKNWWYQMQYIRMLAGRQHFETAIEQVEELKRYYPQRDEVYNLLSSLYRETGEFNKAIDALNQLEVFMGINEQLAIEKFQLYVMLNKDRKATREIIRLVQKYPSESRYKVLLGNIYMERDKSKKAFKLYDQVLKTDPENPYVYVALSNYYTVQKDEEKANEAIISALKNRNLPVETKMEILGGHVDQLQIKSKDLDETEELFRMLIEMYPLNEMTHTYYAIFLEKQKRKEDALEVYESIINIDGKNEYAWRSALQILVERSDTTAILRLTDRGLDQLPKVAEFYYYRAMAHYQMGDLRKALEANQLGIEVLNGVVNPVILSTFYGQVGDIYYQLEERDNSYENYEKALELNPSNVYVLNNYAYYLSEENSDLRKAERMSSRTVEAEPDNSTYLDTYAWIFYKQGDYTLARIYIEKAVENMPKDEQSDVILEHCGDIYAALDDIDKALKMWQKALDVNPENNTAKEKIESQRDLETDL